MLPCIRVLYSPRIDGDVLDDNGHSRRTGCVAWLLAAIRAIVAAIRIAASASIIIGVPSIIPRVSIPVAHSQCRFRMKNLGVNQL